jgi:glycyl-tRNA synthetase beta chain
MPDLLIEIGTEEIPARMLESASEEFSQRVSELLSSEHVAEKPQPQAFSTPRRLAVIVANVHARQANVTERVTGPPVKAAFKDGAPTPAAHAFAKKAGVPVEQLQRVTTPKGEYLAAQVTTPGRNASDVLAAELPKVIAGLYWPKNMYWRAGKPERFVRPVRWMVALLDGEVIPLEFGGVRAGNTSEGHRILGPAEIRVTAPKDYVEELRKAHVIVSPEQRRMTIHSALENALRPEATRNGALRWRENAALLSTVVNLTEFPSIILGSFESEFLSLPEEVLVTVMRDHQKYFAVEDAQGKLAPHFLAVLNTAGDPEGLIRHGNERVLRARFKDARFFWQTDQKSPLTARVEMLKSVTFQKDLGSYYDKTRRVMALCERLADSLKDDGGPDGKKIDCAALKKAAELCKTDLTTELVKEFTELQGIVGGLYVRAQGLGEVVAQAIYHHYQPESMEDGVPPTLEGALLSIADKADSIAGMFALGLIPSGSKDPFALRRQANGIVKIIAEKKLTILAPITLIEEALKGYEGSETAKRFASAEKVLDSAQAFFRERLEFYMREVLGYRYDVVNAVLAVEASLVVKATECAEAVAKVRDSEDFLAISAAVKRMKNILRQAEEKGIFKLWNDQGSMAGSCVPDVDTLTEPAERALAQRTAEMIKDHVARGRAGEWEDYGTTLARLASLRQPIDRYFDEVMVMVDDKAVRDRRLALLAILTQLFSTIADFSEIVTESK